MKKTCITICIINTLVVFNHSKLFCSDVDIEEINFESANNYKYHNDMEYSTNAEIMSSSTRDLSRKIMIFVSRCNYSPLNDIKIYTSIKISYNGMQLPSSFYKFDEGSISEIDITSIEKLLTKEMCEDAQFYLSLLCLGHEQGLSGDFHLCNHACISISLTLLRSPLFKFSAPSLVACEILCNMSAIARQKLLCPFLTDRTGSGADISVFKGLCMALVVSNDNIIKDGSDIEISGSIKSSDGESIEFNRYLGKWPEFENVLSFELPCPEVLILQPLENTHRKKSPIFCRGQVRNSKGNSLSDVTFQWFLDNKLVRTDYNVSDTYFNLTINEPGKHTISLTGQDTKNPGMSIPKKDMVILVTDAEAIIDSPNGDVITYGDATGVNCEGKIESEDNAYSNSQLRWTIDGHYYYGKSLLLDSKMKLGKYKVILEALDKNGNVDSSVKSDSDVFYIKDVVELEIMKPAGNTTISFGCPINLTGEATTVNTGEIVDEDVKFYWFFDNNLAAEGKKATVNAHPINPNKSGTFAIRFTGERTKDGLEKYYDIKDAETSVNYLETKLYIYKPYIKSFKYGEQINCYGMTYEEGRMFNDSDTFKYTWKVDGGEFQCPDNECIVPRKLIPGNHSISFSAEDKKNACNTIRTKSVTISVHCDDQNECTEDYFDGSIEECVHEEKELDECSECVEKKIKDKDCQSQECGECEETCCKPSTGCGCCSLEDCTSDIDNSDPTYIQVERTQEIVSDQSQYYYFPTGSIQSIEAVEFSYYLPYTSLVTINLFRSDGSSINLLSNELRSAGNHKMAWDIFYDSNEPIEDGTYKLIISYFKTNYTSKIQIITSDLVIDTALPNASIKTIKANSPSYDYYDIIGTASDDHFYNYDLFCFGNNQSYPIRYNKQSVINDSLGVMNATDLDDGNYKIVLRVMDASGNLSTTTIPLIIERNSNVVSLYIDEVRQEPIITQLQLSDKFNPSSDHSEGWFDDTLPDGFTEKNIWQWNTEFVYSGSKSHTSPVVNGTSSHYFIHADKTFSLNYNDNIIQYVYLDSLTPPNEILIQFYTNNGDKAHRVYWGANNIPIYGKTGTADLYYMGKIPEPGKWIRLKIPSRQVSLSDSQLKGMSFATYSGKAYWDKTTKSSDLNEMQNRSWLEATNIYEEDRTEVIINYSISKDTILQLDIFDEANNLVKNLLNEKVIQGKHEIRWDCINSDGEKVLNGKYFFQFNCLNEPFDSNTFALISKSSITDSIPINYSIFDSLGNSYTIDADNSSVNKYNSSGNLVDIISNVRLNRDIQLAPLSIDVDSNDNLYILDSLFNIIHRVNKKGFYEFDIILDCSGFPFLHYPGNLNIDDNNSLCITDNHESEMNKYAIGRLKVNISSITAKIRVPYENSLLYAYIPIIGTASAKKFKKYTVEYGYGNYPEEWTTIITSYTRVIDDFRPIPGARTIYGNLATFRVTSSPYQRTGGLPMGTYSIRLRVYNQDDEFKEDIVHVEVARQLRRGINTMVSDDGLVSFYAPNGAIADDVDLFSIVALNENEAPAIDDPELTLMGSIYKIKPAGYQFLKDCTLTMYYKDDMLGDLDENTLKIYRWNPMINKWIFVYADLDIENNNLTTTLSAFNDYNVYYAIISDPPPAPVLYALDSPTLFTNITIFGTASPSVKVDLYVNHNYQCSSFADVDTGLFSNMVNLNIGTNQITAFAVDPVGNSSPESEPVSVVVALSQPIQVTSVSFQTEDFSSEYNGKVGIDDHLYIELLGLDNDPSSINSALVVLKSIDDPKGITIQLIESQINSGKYHGIATVRKKSDFLSASIGIATHIEDMITVTYGLNITDTILTIDTIPPQAPVIHSQTHASLCQNTFEIDLDQWANMSNSYGADVTRTTNYASSGNYSIKMTNTEEGGDFATYIRSTPYLPSEYPMISFDYLIPNDSKALKLNLIAYVKSQWNETYDGNVSVQERLMWKEIVFTDDPKTVETFDDDLYRTIGQIENIIVDNAWHHVSVNLYNLLKADEPDTCTFTVQELFFADYNLPEWMELVMGNENPKGTGWYVDNLIIRDAGCANPDPIFEWLPDDDSVVGFSYLLDKSLDSIPDKISEGDALTVHYQNIEDGTWYFHLRSIDRGGLWGPANHFQIVIDTTGPEANTPIPENNTSHGSMEIKLHITDHNGSGVNPDTIKLQLNDVIFDINSGGFVYDSATDTMTFSLWKVSPMPAPWTNGEMVHASLIEVSDFAGNTLKNIFSWSWTVDYQQLTGGFLSLLTTSGGQTPSWSPDGNTIAFMSERSGNEDIWIIDSDDYAEHKTSPTQLTFDENADHHPCWCPINNSIAFISNRNGNDHIFVIQSDGTGLTQLTFGDNDDSHPYWSPDGSKIVFSRNNEIWISDTIKHMETQLTIDSIEYLLEPTWSPDGKRISFTKTLYSDQIAIMDLDTKKQYVLTDSGMDILPTWSKQTSQIIFTTQRDQQTSSLRIINTDGSGESVYLNNQQLWWDTEPDQCSIDDRIAFQSTRNGSWNIWVKTRLNLGNVTVNPNPFSPNNDDIKDTTTIQYELIGGASSVNIKILDKNNDIVRTLIPTMDDAIPNTFNAVWDGKNDDSDILADDIYSYSIVIQGTAGSASIVESGSITIDTLPPDFSEWTIPELSDDSQEISINVFDQSNINSESSKLQYGIASESIKTYPDIIGWTDFSTGCTGILNLNWLRYHGKYILVRAYAEDNLGNAAYSDIEKQLISELPVIVQKIPLHKGLNFFSFGINRCFYVDEIPTVSMIDGIEFVRVDQISDVLHSIDGQYSIVMGFDATGPKTYDQTPLCDMKYLAAGYGYKIWIHSDATVDDNGLVYLELTGPLTSGNKGIQLNEGLNLVGYLGNNAQYFGNTPIVAFPENTSMQAVDRLSDIFTSIEGSFFLVKGLDKYGPKTYDLTPLCDFRYAGQGYAYLIYVNKGERPVLIWESYQE